MTNDAQILYSRAATLGRQLTELLGHINPSQLKADEATCNALAYVVVRLEDVVNYLDIAQATTKKVLR
jgi:hypothetical protein